MKFVSKPNIENMKQKITVSVAPAADEQWPKVGWQDSKIGGRDE